MSVSRETEPCPEPWWGSSWTMPESEKEALGTRVSLGLK